jgi:hypothetical protein
VTAGQSASLDFSQGETSVQTAANPADAKPHLSSQETKFSGLVCEFPTAALTADSHEATNHAVIETDSQQQVCEQAVSLTIDESHEDRHQAGAVLRSSRAGSSNWLVVLSLGGAALGLFAWRRRQAVLCVRSQAA